MDLLTVGDTVLYADDLSQAAGKVTAVIMVDPLPDPEMASYVVEWPEGEPRVDEFHRAQLVKVDLGSDGLPRLEGDGPIALS